MQIQGTQTLVHELQGALGLPYNRLFLHKKETYMTKRKTRVTHITKLILKFSITYVQF